MLRRVLATWALFLLLAPGWFATAPLAHADGGLDFASTVTYTLDPDAGVVRVRTEAQLTNTVPDTVTGNIINRTYYRGFTLPAPADATNVVATDARGRTLTTTRRPLPDQPDFVLYEIDFAQRLFHSQTARVTVTYDLQGLEPRSENPSRVNPAYASFEAFGVGDDGKVTVRVVVPLGFAVDLLGNEMTETKTGATNTYVAENIADPASFDVFVSARDDRRLLTKDVSTDGGADFTVRAWPDDPAWESFVTEQITTGVPKLEELVGRPWPINGAVEVRQAYTPYLYGYAGWFSAQNRELEVGEDLDAEVVLHELSHAWFNERWFSDRWVNEGLAQVYSNLAVDELGGTALRPDPIDDDADGFVRLNDWGDPNFTDGADEVEDFGYNASFAVMQELYDELGGDAMTDVIAAVDSHALAYLGEDPDEKGPSVTDWRHLLDVLERVGGSRKARELFADHVVSTTDLDLLDDRDELIGLYSSLEERGGSWAVPLVVRRSMANWEFDDAAKQILAANVVLTKRDELDTKAGQLGATYPDTYETDYQAVAKEFDDVSAAIQEQIDTADELLAADAALQDEGGFFDTIGRWGTDMPTELAAGIAAFGTADHDAARAAAAHVSKVAADAHDVGLQRFLWAVGGLVLLILVIVLLIVLLRRRKRRAAPVPALEPPTLLTPEPGDVASHEPGEVPGDVPSDEPTLPPPSLPPPGP